MWKSSPFSGHVFFQNTYAMSIEFTSTISEAQWVLTNIYAPGTLKGKQQFLQWFHNIDMADDIEWLLVGDFNLLRMPSDRNKPDGNVHEMLQFNAVISNLRLVELQLIGTKYTWTNNQESLLLECLDCFFASVSLMTCYPSSIVKTMSWDTFDHCPCLIIMSTHIPKAKVFKFENYWLWRDEFMQVLRHGWNLPVL
jgi:hypothetical protein